MEKAILEKVRLVLNGEEVPPSLPRPEGMDQSKWRVQRNPYCRCWAVIPPGKSWDSMDVLHLPSWRTAFRLASQEAIEEEV